MSYPPMPAGQRRRPPTVNHRSFLLSDSENDQVFKLLGRKCSTLSTGVAQVFLGQANRWNKKGTGAVCFVKDNPKRSYYIRVFNLSTGEMQFEQELYNHFKYASPRPYFHTFDTDYCRAGLNFADEMEANHFKSTIEDKIRQKQEKKNVPMNQNHGIGNNHSQPLQIPATNIQGGMMHEESKKEKKKKKGKKGKISKADIGIPQGFKHVGHVGWDPNKGFDMNEVDPALKDLFNQAGVSDSQLKDKETAQFIYDFIERRGGVDAVKQKSQTGPPPPPPSRGTYPNRGGAPPPPPSRARQGPPPPPPSRNEPPPPAPPSRAAAYSSQPQRGGPPPPPPSHRGARGALPRPPMIGTPPPLMGAPPPPAPPPPPPVPSMPNAPPAPPPPPPPAGGGRDGLLDQIRGGTSLKAAGDRPPPEPETGHGALLDQIRHGMKLKTVTRDEMERPPMEEEDDGGIAGALARALQQREKAIHDSDSDSDEEFNEDDDDWDD